jgi:hypothetical protein
MPSKPEIPVETAFGFGADVELFIASPIYTERAPFAREVSSARSAE